MIATTSDPSDRNADEVGIALCASSAIYMCSKIVLTKGKDLR